MLSRPQPKVREADTAMPEGQESANLALEVAAAGGKSMLAARLPSILPPLLPAELLEVSMIASVAGEIDRRRWRPTRLSSR